MGPPSVMEKQMVHFGVPMKVHVSRSDYELIYGGNFHNEEKGMTETNWQNFDIFTRLQLK
jgi:hypothetical protein